MPCLMHKHGTFVGRCAACERLREIEEGRRTTYADDIRAEARAQGAAEERRRLVAWLRDGSRHGTDSWSEADAIADAIERGDPSGDKSPATGTTYPSKDKP
jgi:hypothetical protein